MGLGWLTWGGCIANQCWPDLTIRDRIRSQFGAAVADDHARLSSPGNQVCEFAHDRFARDRRVRNRCQALTRQIIHALLSIRRFNPVPIASPFFHLIGDQSPPHHDSLAEGESRHDYAMFNNHRLLGPSPISRRSGRSRLHAASITSIWLHDANETASGKLETLQCMATDLAENVTRLNRS